MYMYTYSEKYKVKVNKVNYNPSYLFLPGWYACIGKHRVTYRIIQYLTGRQNRFFFCHIV